MITFKCKMCGGDLSFEPGASVAECPYCGTTQTLPKLDDDKRANLYDRANHFRRQNEYDKAMAIYEQILAEDRTDAEAYWSLVLCRYGIEYVEDPATHKRVPTVNRVQYAPILADEDYKSALQYADTVQRGVYEAEAAAIAEIQRGILDISRQEKPFDVFICYKETDANGRRTPDSVLATEMYHELTKEGFKVFFSRITLEDKIGNAYEPYIFAALNSARVMVALGTKPEYFNAVWVKNEWSRYLALIQKGADKTLVPAYRDMDPYDLPEEFAHLQAQDMGKLGFMQDLIRGIKKILRRDEPKPQTTVQQVVTSAGANIDNLMKRARLFMEDGDWTSANEYLDKVLDENAEYAPAYVGKVQAAMKLRKIEELSSCLTEYEKSPDWQKAVRFATSKERKIYEEYVIGAREARKEKYRSETYAEALNEFELATTPEACAKAKNIFSQISGYRDADEKMEECDWKATKIVYDRLESRRKTVYINNDSIDKMRDLKKLSQDYQAMGDYRDAPEKAADCLASIERVQENLYNMACQQMNTGVLHSMLVAESRFRELRDYRDSEEKLRQCMESRKALQQKKEQLNAVLEHKSEVQKKQSTLKTAEEWVKLSYAFRAIGNFENAVKLADECDDKAEEIRLHFYEGAISSMQAAKDDWGYRSAAKLFEDLGDYRDAREKQKECEQRAIHIRLETEKKDKRTRKVHYFIMILVLLLVGAAIYYFSVIKPNQTYNSAIKAMNSGRYDEATEVFVGLGNYKDAETQAKESQYQKAMLLLTSGENYKAYKTFSKLADYKDVDAQCKTMLPLVRDELAKYSHLLSTSDHTVGVKADGTAVAVGWNEYGQCNVKGWGGIVAVSAGSHHTVGLKSDGRVIAVGDNTDYKGNHLGQCDVRDWTDIVAVSACGAHTVGLKSDGTVVAVGSNNDGQCNVGRWTDIVAVSAGGVHTVGLKSDGTVVAVGRNMDSHGNYLGQCNVGDWRDIVAISAGSYFTVGLKEDGTVVAVGENDDGQCDVGDWTDIVAVSAGGAHTVGLKSDGTVVAIGENYDGRCDVKNWTDIVAVSAGDHHTVGLKSDGTVVAVGSNGPNYDDRLEVTDWKLWN